MEVHGGADTHLQSLKDPIPEHIAPPEKGCDIMESLYWSSLMADLWTHGDRSPYWSRFACRTCDPMGDPHCRSLFLEDETLSKRPVLEHLMKNCSPWEGSTLQKFMKYCLPQEGHHTGAEEECEESSP
ncbi:hypothetical protein AV530_016964 [Patagioenas fasciata monilis]|uniref:Uncharacterized protein n=1 Tax=Patagioenas fasciata monilis TaxID=372326 RepID=A0A1V4J4J3_PATFA|nr:hypothetical protein AV530_016964 [Patagioenas fasciata monilis]